MVWYCEDALSEGNLIGGRNCNHSLSTRAVRVIVVDQSGGKRLHQYGVFQRVVRVKCGVGKAAVELFERLCRRRITLHSPVGEHSVEEAFCQRLCAL